MSKKGAMKKNFLQQFNDIHEEIRNQQNQVEEICKEFKNLRQQVTIFNGEVSAHRDLIRQMQQQFLLGATETQSIVVIRDIISKYRKFKRRQLRKKNAESKDLFIFSQELEDWLLVTADRQVLIHQNVFSFTDQEIEIFWSVARPNGIEKDDFFSKLRELRELRNTQI